MPAWRFSRPRRESHSAPTRSSQAPASVSGAPQTIEDVTALVNALAEEHGADIFFSHDMDAWRGYKHAPDFYEL